MYRIINNTSVENTLKITISTAADNNKYSSLVSESTPLVEDDYSRHSKVVELDAMIEEEIARMK